MKKYILLGVMCLLLQACATVGRHGGCSMQVQVPNFWQAGYQLAAWRLQASAKGYGLDGVLQIKRTDDNTYQATVYTAMGYVLLQADVRADGTDYTILFPQTDRASVRHALQRFWTMLLFAPQQDGQCHWTAEGREILYKKPHKLLYTYQGAQPYPSSVRHEKTIGHAQLSWQAYTRYEEMLLPQQMIFEEGPLQVKLQLMRLKK